MRSKNARDPVEFGSLIRRWTQQANNQGFSFRLIDTKRLLAVKMQHMDFDKGTFRERTLAEEIFGKRRRR